MLTPYHSHLLLPCSLLAERVGCTSSVLLLHHSVPVRASSALVYILNSTFNTIFVCKDSSDIDEYAQKALKDVANWFSRLDSLVVGPGIGRDPLNLECSRLVIESARHHELPLILDADGLYIVTQNLQLIQGCSLVVLTPNINELRRLARKLDIPHDDLEPAATEARMRIAVAVAGKLNGPTIVSKGSVDIIAGGNTVLTCSGSSSNRRCGGLGDVLAGCISVFYHWSKRGEGAFKSKDLSVAVLAAYGACYTVRKASVIAFTRMGRSMLCGDVIADIGQALSGLENGEKE